MSASAEAAVTGRLYEARQARQLLSNARTSERDATVTFVDEALLSHWTWERIGTSLGITATAARRYYQRNRRNTHGGA